MTETTGDAPTKACPACAERILLDAKKCKHCGEWLETKPAGKRGVVAYVSGGVGVVSGVVGLLKGFTGPDASLVQVLVEIGVFGFAMYAALIPTSFLVLGLAKAMPEIEDDDRVMAGAFLVVGLLVAAAIRFGLFADDLTSDIDAFGTFFTALCGVAVVTAALWAIGRVKGTE